MPTDPATVPPLTEQDIAQIVRNTYGHDKHGVDLGNTSDAKVFERVAEWPIEAIRAAYALAASRVDTAEVERRAARKALAECAAWLGKGESQPVRFDEDGRFLLAFERVNAFSDRYLAREYPAPAPRECRKHEGDFFGVPLYSDPNCPADRVVFEYEGKAVACALIHPDSTALRRNAAEVGQ